MMNKQILPLGLLLCMAFSLSACSATDHDDDTTTSGIPLEIEAEVQGTQPRATDTDAVYDKKAFVEGDVIAITDGSNSTYNYQYISGKWKPAVSGSYHTISSGNAATYTGSYPSDFSSVQSDQTTREGFRNSNPLKTLATSPSGNLLSFTGEKNFAPQAAKITIIVTYIEDRTPVSATIAATGTNAANLCNTSGNEHAVKCLYTAGATSTATSTHNWECIVLPGNHTPGFTIVSKIGDTTEKTGTFTASQAIEMKAGYNYVFSFSTSNDLILNSVTVLPFTDAPSQDAGSAS